jgi:hypothetical protein
MVFESDHINEILDSYKKVMLRAEEKEEEIN